MSWRNSHSIQVKRKPTIKFIVLVFAQLDINNWIVAINIQVN